MRSDLIATLKAALLPEEGSEFERTFVTPEGREIRFGEEPHAYATATSEALRIVAWGEGVKVYERTQEKPPQVWYPRNGPRDPETNKRLGEVLHAGGPYRRMLIIEYGGDARLGSGSFFVHVLGDLIVCDTRRRNIGELVPGRLEKHRRPEPASVGVGVDAVLKEA